MFKFFKPELFPHTTIQIISKENCKALKDKFLQDLLVPWLLRVNKWTNGYILKNQYVL
jgi:hypothetical protein